MSKVSVTKEKLDTLAEAVGAKSGESIPLTIDEMTDAVLSIPEINNQSKTVTPTESVKQVVPDSGYTGLDSVTIRAIPSNYVGSGIETYSDGTLYSSYNASAGSPLVITGPPGFYPNGARKEIAENTIDARSLTVSDDGTATMFYYDYGGYAKSGYKNSNTMSINTYQHSDIWPSNTSEVLPEKSYLTGNVTIKGAPLVAKTATPTNTTQVILPDNNLFMEYHGTVTENDANFDVILDNCPVSPNTLYSVSGQITYEFIDTNQAPVTRTIQFDNVCGARVIYLYYTTNTTNSQSASIDLDCRNGNAILSSTMHAAFYAASSHQVTINLIIKQLETNYLGGISGTNGAGIKTGTIDLSNITLGSSKITICGRAYHTDVFPIHTFYVERIYSNSNTAKNIYYLKPTNSIKKITIYPNKNTNNLQIEFGSSIVSKYEIWVYEHTDVSPDYYGLSSVTVNPVPIDTSSTLTSNGVHTASSGSFWSSVTVSVPLKSLTVTPSNSQQVFSDKKILGMSYESTNGGMSPNIYLSSNLPNNSSLYLSGIITTNAESQNIVLNEVFEYISGSQEYPLKLADGSTAINSVMEITNNQILFYSNNSYSTYTSLPNPELDNRKVVAVYEMINGYLPVTVNPIPSEYIIPSGTLNISTNGTKDVTNYASVNVAVPSQVTTLQNKTITPTETTQTVSADSGYTGLGTVTVSAIPTTYVGTGITRNPTPTASGGTVTIPSGYYETSTSKSVDTATVGTISVAVNASGLVTATATSPAGYFAGGTKTATMQLSTQADATIIPSEEEQVLSTSGKYMLGDITIEAIETESATAVSNGTVYPSTGKYLSQVTVAVPSDIHNQNKEITPTESAQTVSADVGYSGLGTVTVKAISQTYVGSAVPKNPTPTINGKTVTVPIGYYNTAQTVTIGNEYIVPTGTTTITSNGTYNVTAYASANVNIPSDIHNQAKTVTPTESIQTISADSGYSGLSTVTVEAISSEYIGSGVTTRSAADLTISRNSVTAPAGYYASNATATISQYDLTAPTVVLTNSTGEIQSTAAIATGKGGYYAAQSATKTLSLTTQTGTTITPTATSQTAVAQYRWTTGTITVAAVPTDTNNSFSANGTYTPESGKWFSSVTVEVPSDINNQNKTVIPTESVQTISADSGYSGLGTVTVSNIPNNYVGSAIQTRSLSDIQSVTWTYSHNSTYPYVSHTMSIPAGYYPNGSTGYGYTLILNDIKDLPKQGATTITPTTTQQTAVSKWTWTTGDIIVDAIPVSTISNAALNISTVTESTNDYGVEAEITIPAGYYNTTTLSALISDVLPIPATAAVVSQILSGYEAYDYQGKLLAGTMTNRAAWNAILNDTITSTTIPAGYHNGSGTVSHTTVNIPDPMFSMNNSTGVITASGTWTKGFTTDNSYSNTYSLTTQAGKTVTPTESAQTAVAANRWTTGTITVAAIPNDYVGSGITTRTSLNMSANTVTASAGYYPNAVTVTVTAMTLPTSAVTTSAGTAKATITRSTATRYINIPVGYNSTAAHYVISAVANGTVVPPTTITGSQATVTAGTNVLTFSKSISVTPNVTTAGYISAGTASNVTVTLSAAITTKAGATITPGTTNQTIAGGTYLTGTQTIAGDADLVAGNIKTGVNIFGVTGTYAGLDTSDATAIAGDIVLGETAYVDGEKITGTLVVQDYYTGTTAPSNSLGQNGDIYLRGGSL